MSFITAAMTAADAVWHSCWGDIMEQGTRDSYPHPVRQRKAVKLRKPTIFCEIDEFDNVIIR